MTDKRHTYELAHVYLGHELLLCELLHQSLHHHRPFLKSVACKSDQHGPLRSCCLLASSGCRTCCSQRITSRTQHMPWDKHPLHLHLSIICSTDRGGGWGEVGRFTFPSSLAVVQLNDASRALLAGVPEVSD